MKENLLLALLFTAGAFFVWIKRKMQFASATRARSFPEIKGRIESVDIREDVREDEDDMGRRDRSVTWHPEIRYTFSIAGHVFQGKRYSLLEDPSFHSKDQAQAFSDRFKPGDEITVHYDPSNPKISCLDTRINQRAVDGKTWMLVFFLLAAAAGCLFI